MYVAKEANTLDLGDQMKLRQTPVEHIERACGGATNSIDIPASENCGNRQNGHSITARETTDDRV